LDAWLDGEFAGPCDMNEKKGFDDEVKGWLHNSMNEIDVICKNIDAPN